jgi:hypothetical protein
MGAVQTAGQLYALSLVIVIVGKGLIVDWQGWGTRYYEWNNRADLPGMSWYRMHGGNRLYRITNGGACVLIGILSALATLFHVI